MHVHTARYTKRTLERALIFTPADIGVRVVKCYEWHVAVVRILSTSNIDTIKLPVLSDGVTTRKLVLRETKFAGNIFVFRRRKTDGTLWIRYANSKKCALIYTYTWIIFGANQHKSRMLIMNSIRFQGSNRNWFTCAGNLAWNWLKIPYSIGKIIFIHCILIRTVYDYIAL